MDYGKLWKVNENFMTNCRGVARNFLEGSYKSQKKSATMADRRIKF